MDAYLLLTLSLGWVLSALLYVIPLLCVIVWRKETFLAKDYTVQRRVSVLLPCFNEGPHAYDTIKSISESNYPAELLEIVAVDDHSTDDSWEWIQKAQHDFSGAVRIAAYRQPVNKGKYEALNRAANIATSADIFICIDSDCTFHPDAVRELVASFASDKIAAVGGHVRVSNVNENLVTKTQATVYFYAYKVMKMFQNRLRNVTCISGCLFAIRRDAFFEIEEDVKTCNFLGAKFSAGEDRYMTHLLMLRGYQTAVNLDAICWTEVPTTFRKFFTQQWRWRRSGTQDYLLTLRTLGRHARNVHPLSAMNLILPETVNYLMLFTFIFAIASGNALEWIVSHQVFTYTVFAPFLFGVHFWAKRCAPDQAVKGGPLPLLPFIAAWALAGTVTCAMMAIFTMDSSSWGTRVSKKPEESAGTAKDGAELEGMQPQQG
ncbi:glycosyltransferase family 2 protein [Ralstonia sp. CHL-2022]|uniref:Glycosyltransferase family 2 protein n=1 Tax=Ralstonia mojiangensis TaxID=2953895 RepID=A0AAE3I776_9RALS|nr:glycosyltransferase family 2 protein [Ralstonia mojiangensis]MCT7317918.1 glycosyltransferase family 2 protein [Ralstonia mojiangensis]MCT7328978.1 glycosyltransferase family 2 protein [Ralstonia mojiangensis]